MKLPIRTLICLFSCAVMTLPACGNKGPLTLPNPPAGTQAKPGAQKATATTPADHISQPATESK